MTDLVTQVPNLKVFYDAVIVLAEDEYDESGDMVMDRDLKQLVLAVRAAIGRQLNRLEHQKRALENEEQLMRSSYSRDLGLVIKQIDSANNEFRNLQPEIDAKCRWLKEKHPQLFAAVYAYCADRKNETHLPMSRLTKLRGNHENKKRKLDQQTKDVTSVFAELRDHLKIMDKKIEHTAAKIQEFDFQNEEIKI